MTIRLGVGPYEIARINSPSTYGARLIFLRLLDGFRYKETTFKNDAPTSLHNSVFLNFAVLVLNRFKQSLFTETPLSSFSSDLALFLHLRGRISPEEVQSFLPDHSTLKEVSPETHEKLLSWAQEWNLDSDWCLDFAVEAMRLWLFDRGAREFMLWERALRDNSEGFIWEAAIVPVIEEDSNDTFSFKFENVSFSSASWNFRLEEATEWKRTITVKFLEHLKLILDGGDVLPSGVLSRVVRQFEKEAEQHVRQTTTVITKQGYIKTPKVQDYTPFAWTICYQVLRFGLSKISREFEQPQKTLADGIDRTLALIGLKKRADSRRGRPPGVSRGARKLSLREEVDRSARLNRFITALATVSNPENKSSVARAIGVSPSRFRGAWVPYLIKETGSKNYSSLIRRYWSSPLKNAPH